MSEKKCLLKCISVMEISQINSKCDNFLKFFSSVVFSVIHHLDKNNMEIWKSIFWNHHSPIKYVLFQEPLLLLQQNQQHQLQGVSSGPEMPDVQQHQQQQLQLLQQLLQVNSFYNSTSSVQVSSCIHTLKVFGQKFLL